MTQKHIPTREEHGLPEQSTTVQILYNRAAHVTILELQRDKLTPVHRIYWRSAGEPRYRSLVEPDPDYSLEQAVTCERPVLFMRVVTCRPASVGFVGDTVGLRRADLAPVPMVTALELTCVAPPAARISRLLRANDDGTQLVVIAMIGKKYRLCTLDVDADRLVEHDTLAGVFF